jgi:hypothetical protein
MADDNAQNAQGEGLGTVLDPEELLNARDILNNQVARILVRGQVPTPEEQRMVDALQQTLNLIEGVLQQLGAPSGR